MATSFFKDGNNMGISTTSRDAEEFIYEVSQILSAMIDRRLYEGDWEFQLSYWIPDIVHLVEQLKANRDSRRYHESGNTNQRDLVARLYDTSHVEIVSRHSPDVPDWLMDDDDPHPQ